MKLKFFALMSLLLGFVTLASAQTIDIKGIVTEESGTPVIGASVMIKGTLKGEITDVDGRFALSGVKADDILTVSCIGIKLVLRCPEPGCECSHPACPVAEPH